MNKDLGPGFEERWEAVIRRGDIDDLIDCGVDLAEAGSLDLAATCFGSAARSGDAVASFNLANALRALSRLDEAASAYKAAIDAGESDALLKLGLLMIDIGSWEEAIHYLRRGAAEGLGRQRVRVPDRPDQRLRPRRNIPTAQVAQGRRRRPRSGSNGGVHRG